LEAQKGLLKVKCNPGLLAAAIKEVLGGQPTVQNIDQLLAASTGAQADSPAPQVSPAHAAAPQPKPQARSVAIPSQAPARTAEAQAPNAEAKEQARQELKSSAQATVRNLRELFESFQAAADPKERALRLQALYRKVHFVTAMAGIAENPAIAQMASAFEALLFGMMDKLPNLNPSMERTTAMVVEFLEELLAHPPSAAKGSSTSPLVLVVDDDRVTNRLVVSALRNAQLQARGTENPEVALHWLRERHYELILLDIEMPGMDGLEVCRRVRALPGYEKTPVIYVSSHDDFLNKARTLQSGGNDLIAKPIVPSELAAKALMHLLKSQLASSPTT
jgi:CheY-like chemotaxis protein